MPKLVRNRLLLIDDNVLVLLNVGLDVAQSSNDWLCGAAVRALEVAVLHE